MNHNELPLLVVDDVQAICYGEPLLIAIPLGAGTFNMQA